MKLNSKSKSKLNLKKHKFYGPNHSIDQAFFRQYKKRIKHYENSPRFNHTAVFNFQLILSEIFHSFKITDTNKTIDLSRRIKTYIISKIKHV